MSIKKITTKAELTPFLKVVARQSPELLGDPDFARNLEELLEDGNLGYRVGKPAAVFVAAETETGFDPETGEPSEWTTWEWDLLDWLLCCETLSPEADPDELSAAGIAIR